MEKNLVKMEKVKKMEKIFAILEKIIVTIRCLWLQACRLIIKSHGHDQVQTHKKNLIIGVYLHLTLLQRLYNY
jgi:hypothetical protein